tara:strand:+ start:171 stop:2087 length:1917 start_codon:yes stop_codon:yes gene_type:complete
MSLHVDRLHQIPAALTETKRRRDAFVALDSDTPASDVVRAFDRIGLPLVEVLHSAGVMPSVHPDADVRQLAETRQQEAATFATEMSLDREVFERLSKLELPADADAATRRRLEHALRDFRRSGVDRDEATRDRVRALQDRMVELGQTFDRAIAQSSKSIVFEGGHAVLSGLPADFLASHPEGEDGSVTITTDPPDALPIMMYADDVDVRKRLYMESMTRAYPENFDTLRSLLSCRRELAQLLGYDSWADYVTEDKMSKSGGRVAEFIDQVSDLSSVRGTQEYADLLEEKRKTDPTADSVELYEWVHLVERIRKQRFDFDSQEARAYFPYDATLKGLLELTSELYGVTFQVVQDADTWHADVVTYDLLEKGEVIGRFHLDMFPRKDKYKHAMMVDFVVGLDGEFLPEGGLVCNFSKPKDGDPALMLHTQVTTLFHEFGHLMHFLMARRHEYLAFGGISCEWDFVEVPSQLYEEWAWDPAVLARFAKKPGTDQAIPADLVQRMRAAEEYGKGLRMGIQMTYATQSLDLHRLDPATIDFDAITRQIREQRTPFREVEGTHQAAQFGHLNGYSAIYYTYAWSDVIARDLWREFESDVMNADKFGGYKDKVLAAGGSQDAADMVESFLGRPFSFDAYEAWLSR